MTPMCLKKGKLFPLTQGKVTNFSHAARHTADVFVTPSIRPFLKSMGHKVNVPKYIVRRIRMTTFPLFETLSLANVSVSVKGAQWTTEPDYYICNQDYPGYCNRERISSNPFISQGLATIGGPLSDNLFGE